MAHTMTRSLPLIDELEAALSTGSDARRVEMLTRLTDLFVGAAERYSDEQVGVFDDVMARLGRAPLKPKRGSPCRNGWPRSPTPPRASSTCSPSTTISPSREPVLHHSPRLDDPALVANANSKSQRHLFAISQRQRLSEAVTDILVQRGDRLVVHSVAKNAGALFSDTGFANVGHARGQRRRPRHLDR